MVPLFFFTSFVYQDMQQYTNQISGEAKLAGEQTYRLFSHDWQDASQCADLHKHSPTLRSVLTALLRLLRVLCSVASESWKARCCECHAAIVSSVKVESYSKHGQACESSVCPLHMWGSVKSNNAECWHSGRGNDRDYAFKEQLKHASTSVSCGTRG